MIFYYIRYSECWTDGDITHYRKEEEYFSTKQKAELFWKKEISDAKAHNKFPMPHQIDWMVKFDSNAKYVEISKDRIRYNAPNHSNFLVTENKKWVRYDLEIQKPKKLVLRKNKKDIAHQLTSISTSYYES